jgi:hypothetical protein
MAERTQSATWLSSRSAWVIQRCVRVCVSLRVSECVRAGVSCVTEVNGESKDSTSWYHYVPAHSVGGCRPGRQARSSRSHLGRTARCSTINFCVKVKLCVVVATIARTSPCLSHTAAHASTRESLSLSSPPPIRTAILFLSNTWLLRCCVFP